MESPSKAGARTSDPRPCHGPLRRRGQRCGRGLRRQHGQEPRRAAEAGARRQPAGEPQSPVLCGLEGSILLAFFYASESRFGGCRHQKGSENRPFEADIEANMAIQCVPKLLPAANFGSNSSGPNRMKAWRAPPPHLGFSRSSRDP